MREEQIIAEGAAASEDPDPAASTDSSDAANVTSTAANVTSTAANSTEEPVEEEPLYATAAPVEEAADLEKPWTNDWSGHGDDKPTDYPLKYYGHIRPEQGYYPDNSSDSISKHEITPENSSAMIDDMWSHVPGFEPSTSSHNYDPNITDEQRRAEKNLTGDEFMFGPPLGQTRINGPEGMPTQAHAENKDVETPEPGSELVTAVAGSDAVPTEADAEESSLLQEGSSFHDGFLARLYNLQVAMGIRTTPVPKVERPPFNPLSVHRPPPKTSEEEETETKTYELGRFALPDFGENPISDFDIELEPQWSAPVHREYSTLAPPDLSDVYKSSPTTTTAAQGKESDFVLNFATREPTGPAVWTDIRTTTTTTTTDMDFLMARLNDLRVAMGHVSWYTPPPDEVRDKGDQSINPALGSGDDSVPDLHGGMKFDHHSYEAGDKSGPGVYEKYDFIRDGFDKVREEQASLHSLPGTAKNYADAPPSSALQMFPDVKLQRITPESVQQTPAEH